MRSRLISSYLAERRKRDPPKLSEFYTSPPLSPVVQEALRRARPDSEEKERASWPRARRSTR